MEKIEADEDSERQGKAIEYYSGARSNDGAYAPSNVYMALRNGEITKSDAVKSAIKMHERTIESEYRKRWILHILNRLGYEQSELGKTTLFSGEITPAILQVFTRTHGADKPKATKDGDNWNVASSVDLPMHIGQGAKELTLTSVEWCELMHSVGYEVPAPVAQKVPILNFKAVSIEAVNPWGEDKPYPQVEMTKEEYAKINVDYKGVRYSSCKTFRFKTCIDHRDGGRELVSVFLTNFKTHPAPESDAVTYEVEKDGA